MTVFEDVLSVVRVVTKDWTIKRLRDGGMNTTEIAKKIGCSKSTVRRSIKKTSGWTKGEKA